MHRVMIVFSILLLLCTSCTVSNHDQASLPSISQFQTDDASLTTNNLNTSDTTSETALDFPLYLPLPYSYVFGLEKGDIDAFLHDTAVNNYSTRENPKDGSLALPSLRLIDTWEAEDGGTYYLCFMRRIDYYDLAKFLKNNTSYNDPFYDGSGVSLGELVRFKIFKDEFSYYYDWSCTELLESFPSDDGGYSIRYMCGDNVELADMIINTPKDVPYIRDILPSADDKEALLNIYLDYFRLQ